MTLTIARPIGCPLKKKKVARPPSTNSPSMTTSGSRAAASHARKKSIIRTSASAAGRGRDHADELHALQPAMAAGRELGTIDSERHFPATETAARSSVPAHYPPIRSALHGDWQRLQRGSSRDRCPGCYDCAPADG